MKEFYKRKPGKNYRKEVREFLKTFNVKVRFVRKGWSSAVADQLIEIDIREADTIQKLWSCVFHELGHIRCWREGKYDTYHKETLSQKKLAKYIRRYGLRAERYVDKVGGKMMKAYFPDIPFLPCYGTEHEVKWYRKWVKRNYPL